MIPIDLTTSEANQLLTESWGKPLVLDMIVMAVHIGDVDQFMAHFEPRVNDLPPDAREAFRTVTRIAAIGWLQADAELRAAALN